jgi:hypothetical protein
VQLCKLRPYATVKKSCDSKPLLLCMAVLQHRGGFYHSEKAGLGNSIAPVGRFVACLCPGFGR